ncbi:MAG: class I SAM-dependent methyltransferase [Bacteroidota bacterium]
MPLIPGTTGYAERLQAFTEATLALPFEVLHQDFLPYFPEAACRVLDVGAGIGRDAHTCWEMGHTVIAVEPLEAFRKAGQVLFPTSGIRWKDDALPSLSSLEGPFEMVLASGVWHHLRLEEQADALKRVADLLVAGGRFFLSLRNGPAAVGTHTFPTEVKASLDVGAAYGLSPLLVLENQPSLMKHKKEVRWARIVFKKNDVASSG